PPRPVAPGAPAGAPPPPRPAAPGAPAGAPPPRGAAGAGGVLQFAAMESACVGSAGPWTPGVRSGAGGCCGCCANVVIAPADANMTASNIPFVLILPPGPDFKEAIASLSLSRSTPA